MAFACQVALNCNAPSSPLEPTTVNVKVRSSPPGIPNPNNGCNELPSNDADKSPITGIDPVFVTVTSKSTCSPDRIESLDADAYGDTTTLGSGWIMI